eukprot:s1176_g2.t1
MAAAGRRPIHVDGLRSPEEVKLRKSFRQHQKRAAVDLKRCNAVLSSFAKGDHWRSSLELISHFSSWNVQADTVSVSMAFSAMTRERPWQNALHLLDSLDLALDTMPGTTGSIEIFTNLPRTRWIWDESPNVLRIAMNALMRLLPWRRALNLLQWMTEGRITPDQITYNAALNALDSTRNWQLVLELLASMPEQRVTPDLRNWNSAMKVCGHAGQWSWALALFHELSAPDNVSFLTAISACPGAQWPLALHLLALADDVATCSATLQVLATSGMWQISLHILTRNGDDWRDFDVAQDLRPMIRALNGQRFSYNTILEEFSRLGQWQKSLDLLSVMISSRVPPDEYSYGLCIGSCDTAGAWQLALRLLGVMPARSLTPQLKSYQVAAGVCAHAGEWQAVLRLVEMLGPEDTNKVSWALEVCSLRGHGRTSAELALHASLPRDAEAEDPEVRLRFLMAMQTCVSAREWPLVVGLFEQLPQVRVTTNGTAALGGSGWVQPGGRCWILKELVELVPDFAKAHWEAAGNGHGWLGIPESMVADNTDNFLEVRCHKVLICDPRDQMILDPAALRTEVALKVLERLSPEERIQVDDGTLKSFEEAWRFFDVLFSLREGEEDDAFCGRSRQLAAADSRPEVRGKALEERGEGRGTGAGAQGERLKSSWLEDHPDVVRLLLPCEDQLQQLFELCEGIEGAGLTLPEALEGKNCCHSLRCLIANMQVWGAVGNPRAEGADFALLTLGQEIPQILLEIDQFLSKDDVSAHYVSPTRLEELMKTLHPDVVARYHRQLARMRVTVVWREFRRRQSLLQGALGNLQVPPGDLSQLDLDRLVRTVLLHLDEIGGFISLLAGFFKSVDLVNVDDAQAGHDARPVIDRPRMSHGAR